jgi:hypothetical protein
MNMHLRYSLSFEDYYEFQMAWNANRKSLVMPTAKPKLSAGLVTWGAMGILVLAMCIISNLVSPAPPAAPAPPRPAAEVWSDLGWGLFPYIVVLIVIWMFLLWMRRSRFVYRRLIAGNVRLGEPCSAEVMESHLTLVEPGCRTEMEWTYILRLIETKSTFLFFVLPRMAHIIPKRAFASPEALAEFRAFAEARVGNKVIGFPVQPGTGTTGAGGTP